MAAVCDMEKNIRQIVVIGGGPGGYVAALRAAMMGAEVTVIEKERLGGTCLNRGCIPTKSFLNSAEAFEAVKEAGNFGIEVNGTSRADFRTVVQRKDEITNQLVSGIGFLFKKRGVKKIEGTGKLLSAKEVEITLPDSSVKVIGADAVILATGSQALVPPMFGYDGNLVITSDEALRLTKLPKSILIVGGGVIGCEFGQFYKKLGADVWIVEMADQILPMEDKETADILAKELKRNGVNLHTGCKVELVKKNVDSVTVTLSDGREITAECMLLSIGRKPNIEGSGIENTGISVHEGKIVTNAHMETNIKGIYAIGDIVNSPFLAHVASKEGIIAAENAMGRESNMTYHAVPRCVYTDPEIAGVGITEQEAVKSRMNYRLGKFSFAGIGKALVTGKTKGIVKVIVDENDVIRGASIVGPHATELLAELTLAVELGLTAEQIGNVIHPHPTLTEALMEAVHDVHGKSVHAF
ncbi:MAG TPA: dihydrolipoyl dehydrogenase [Anaerovoracaceae bacterium]|nr:dihydrolipoyl dehydrogenase [Anaerovoracaceae bacterium]